MNPEKRTTPEDKAFFRYLRRPTRRGLAKVVRLYHIPLWNVALRLTGCASDASDLCQDVFLALLLKPPGPSSVRSPKGYLVSRLSSLSKDRRRSAERRRARESQVARDRLIEEGLAGEEVETLRRVVDELPEDLRVAISLRYFVSFR